MCLPPPAGDRYTRRIGESFIGIQPSKRRSCRRFAHDLKHTGVAFLAAAGVDPSEIARRAGHSSVAFSYDRYGYLLPEVDKQAGAKLELLRSSYPVTGRAECTEQVPDRCSYVCQGPIGAVWMRFTSRSRSEAKSSAP